ncbi:MAG TPA: MFS transporter, partial [Nitrososphaeraceae archaeon]
MYTDDYSNKEEKLNHNNKDHKDNRCQESSTYSEGTELSDTSESIRTHVWVTLAILGLTILITTYGQTMLLPAIRDIIRDFDISYSMSSWILTANLISAAAATPIAGKLSDIYGRKKMIVIILIVYTVGITAGGFSTNISVLFVARGIQGIGISMFPIAFGIIRDQLPKEKLAIGVGVFSSMFAAGSVVGLALGGIIIQSFGWHTTFLSIIPIAIILLVMIKRFIHDDNDNKKRLAGVAEKGNPLDEDDAYITKPSRIHFPNPDHRIVISNRSSGRRKQSLDLKGAITLAITITSFLLTLTYISNNSNSNVYPTQAIGLSLGFLSIGSLILFVLIERKASSPLIEMSLMTHKILLPANIIILIFGMTMFLVYQTIPILVRSPYPLGFGGDAVASAIT